LLDFHITVKSERFLWMQMMERATRRRDRLSLLTLLEGSVESKKSFTVFNALLDAGGLKALNTWLADAVRLFSMSHTDMVTNGSLLSQENEKSSVKLWQRVLNFLNRYSWTPVLLPSAKPTAQVGSLKDIKKEIKADRGGLTIGSVDHSQRSSNSDHTGIAASAGPESTRSNGTHAKLAKIESASHESSAPASASTNSASEHCNGLKVETAAAMQVEAVSSSESNIDDKLVTELGAVKAERSQPVPVDDDRMEDISTAVKLEVTEIIDLASCDSSSATQDLHIVEKESEMPIDLSKDAAETQAGCLPTVHIHEKTADSCAQDGSHMKSDGYDAKETNSVIDKAAAVVSTTEVRSEKGNVISPRAGDSGMLIVVDGCDGSASESGTPRYADSREPSDADLGVASSKAEKPRKESKSKSDKNGKGKTAHELVVLIVEVCNKDCFTS
jgi:hypothetical protein